MRPIHVLICGALLGAGVLLSGCGAGSETPAPPANNPAGSATGAPAANSGAYPPPAAAASQPPANVTSSPPTTSQGAYPLPGTAGQDQGISDANAGQTITLKVGQTLLVELHDRKWSAPVVDAKILAVAPLNIAVPQGATAWKFRAIAAGRTNLTTDGACPPAPSGGATCLSILQYKVMIVVTS